MLINFMPLLPNNSLRLKKKKKKKPGGQSQKKIWGKKQYYQNMGKTVFAMT